MRALKRAFNPATSNLVIALLRASSARPISTPPCSEESLLSARVLASLALLTSIFCGHSTASARIVIFSGVISTKPERSAACFSSFLSVMMSLPGAIYGIIFHHVDVIGIKNPVRRDDFESECFVCHRITYLLYLANTSSIFPAFKNIPSGISSYLPSRISLNP